jgi:hypothetical protein
MPVSPRLDATAEVTSVRGSSRSRLGSALLVLAPMASIAPWDARADADTTEAIGGALGRAVGGAVSDVGGAVGGAAGGLGGAVGGLLGGR